jgi:hypothetical protein
MNSQKTLSMRSKLFGSPGLPNGLVFLVLLLIFTQTCALLMNQPAAYWLDPQYASRTLPFGFLLGGGPWLFLGVSGLYIIFLALLLLRLRAPVGLFLAAMLSVPHSITLARAIPCGFSPLNEAHSFAACHVYRYVPLVLFFSLFGLGLAVERIPERWMVWGKRLLIPLALSWVCLMGFGVIRAAFPPSSPWKVLAPAHSPGPRTMAAVAYDSKRQRAVLFGGITYWDGSEWVYDNITWEWDGQDWHRMETTVAPTGRILHAMAYDEERGKVILYGGQNSSGNLADLWEWDGNTWRRLCPVCNPAARFTHKMVFDTERQKILLYGGQDGKVGLAQAWTWDGQKWEFFQFNSSAPGAYNAPLIYDPGRNRVISFMGGMWGGTWVWKDDKWNKLEPSIEPPVRDQATLVYDPLKDQSVLFGGLHDNETMFDDTWILQGETWYKLTTSISPNERFKAISFYDPIRKSIILYGGEKMGLIYGDMWELKVP